MRKEVQEILNLENKYSEYTKEQLIAETNILKVKYEEVKDLKKIRNDAFALVREAAYRLLDMKAFPVQILGALELSDGNLIEQKTGEGKTLVSLFPAYLHGITGEGVHIITVNEYLADRDSKWMGQVLDFLGLSVGLSLSNMSDYEKKRAYQCDVTYVTNSEVGFDYLRGFLNDSNIVRNLHYCIIDEVDSVLIDEARTPLIISRPIGQGVNLYASSEKLAKSLEKGEGSVEFSKIDAMSGILPNESGDYLVDEKKKTVLLTENGVKKIEKYYGIENYSDASNIKYQHHITMALKAKETMHRNKDYIVKNGKVEIVDEFTGRILDGRRYSDGLHEALEAKERVKIQEESETVARITYQSLFNSYDMKCGMTGTAITDKREFKNIYHMSVKKIPTNVPVQRVDKEDRIFTSKEAKAEAILNDVLKTHELGMPILLGSSNVRHSEELSEMLTAHGLKHTVLNAKNHAKEAKIIENAGKFGHITVATNMAGRGTDIKLDEKAKAAGGLKVIGTDKHDSRRIDDQLRGRSGRQGDPGESVFYVSLDDDFMRMYGSDKVKKLFKNMEGEISTKAFRREVLKAQKRIEHTHYGVRKDLFDYDRIDNMQFKAIMREKKKVLSGFSVNGFYFRNIEDLKRNKKITLDDVRKLLDKNSFIGEETKEELLNAMKEDFKKANFEADNEDRNFILRDIVSKAFITSWTKQLQVLEDLKRVVGYQGLGKNPVDAYQIMVYQQFTKRISDIKTTTIHDYFTR